MTGMILCTIDFSDSSRPVLELAVTLAKQFNAHLTILYAYRLIHSRNEEVLLLKKKTETEAQKKFLMLEKDVLNNNGVDYDFRTEIGFVADRIEDHTKKNAIRFLVMDKRMALENKEMFDELIGHIRVPLVIVP
jgi:nucleotide-binding universal stress UspA family protein